MDHFVVFNSIENLMIEKTQEDILLHLQWSFPENFENKNYLPCSFVCMNPYWTSDIIRCICPFKRFIKVVELADWTFCSENCAIWDFIAFRKSDECWAIAFCCLVLLLIDLIFWQTYEVFSFRILICFHCSIWQRIYFIIHNLFFALGTCFSLHS